MYVHTKTTFRTDDKCLVECVVEGRIGLMSVTIVGISFQSVENAEGCVIPAAMFENSFRGRGDGLTPKEQMQVDAALMKRFHDDMDAKRMPSFRVTLSRDSGETIKLDVIGKFNPGNPHGYFCHKTGAAEAPSGPELDVWSARTWDGEDFDHEDLSESEYERLIDAVEAEASSPAYDPLPGEED